MSRSRNLPALEFGGQGYGTSYSPHHERSVSRLDILEDRLMVQERTTTSLIDKAFKIKNDVIDSMNMTHGTWQEEKNARQLLQEHIKTITEVVKKLGRDIKDIEDELRSHQGMSGTTSQSVRNLEVQQASSLTDLRGRVARCDIAIGKLSSDVKTCYDSLKSLTQKQNQQMDKVMDRFTSLDKKMNEMMLRLDRSSSDYQAKIRNVEGDTSHQLSSLDQRTRMMIEDTRTAVASLQAKEETERNKIEAKISSHLEGINKELLSKQEKLEHRVEEQINLLQGQIHHLEREEAQDRERQKVIAESIEKKLSGKIDSLIRKQQDDIARIKRENREGFTTIQDVITNMRKVMDGKHNLLEELMRKEIGQIRKMVVLI